MKKKIPTIITHHAEIYYTGNCGYAFDCTKWINEECQRCKNPKEVTWNFMFANPHRNWSRLYRSLKKFDTDRLYYTTVSPWLKDRFNLSLLSKGYSCDVVFNGIDTKIFSRKPIDTINKSNMLKPLEYIIYVSSNFDPIDKNDIKGGYYIIELAKLMPEAQFVIVATNNTNCDELPSNIFLWGKASCQEELARLYSNAAVTVLTSRKETFSMICAESLSCGTQVAGFMAGGPESISLMEYSKFVEFGNTELLKHAVEELKGNKYDRDELSLLAHEVYSLENMTSGYEIIYKRLLDKQR